MHQATNTIPTSDTFEWQPLLLACLIVSIGQLSLGFIFPALPSVAEDLEISAEVTQQLVSMYLLSFGASQLFYGPLSDVIGRRKVLLVGLFIAIAGLALAVMNSDSFTWLLIGRFIQGAGAGSVAVLGRATIRDSYQGDALVKAMTWLAIVASLSPIVGPVLGAMVNHHAGWLSVFVLLLTYIALVWLILLFRFKETLQIKHQRQSVGQLVLSYGALIRDRHFLTFAGIGWLNFLMVVLSISMMPFIMQVQIGLTSEEYGFWAVFPAFGFLVGGLLCQRLRPIWGTKRILLVAPFVQLVAAMCLMFAPVEPIWMVAGHVLLAMANGMTFPCAQALLLVPYGMKAGTASALSGAGQMIFASLLSSLLLKLGCQLPWHLGGLLLITSIMGFLIISLGTHKVANEQVRAALG